MVTISILFLLEKLLCQNFIPFLTNKYDKSLIELSLPNQESKKIHLIGEFEEFSIKDFIEETDPENIIIISETEYRDEMIELRDYIENRDKIKAEMVLLNSGDLKEEETKLEYKKFESFIDKEFLNFLDLKEDLLDEVTQKYSVDSFNTPTDTTELDYWDKYVLLESPVRIPKSKIVKGKQLGRTIGIPTANLPLDNSLICEFNLLPGIYFGVCLLFNDDRFKNLEGVQLPMVASIGTNRHFNEERISYEFMILHDFNGEEFYGSELSVTLSGFIRPEASFWTFDMFVRAMECDIKIAKDKIFKYSLL